jgi:O-antigen/teichoic acid export membrane protein
VLNFPVLFLGIFFAPRAITLIYGPEYTAAASALPWLVAAEIPVIAGVVYGYFSLAAKLQKFDVIFTLLNFAANVGLCVVLIPRMGLIGAAIASLIGYAMSWPFQLAFKATRSYSVVLLREQLRLVCVGLAAWAGFTLAVLILPTAAAALVTMILLIAASIWTGFIRREDLKLLELFRNACRGR